MSQPYYGDEMDSHTVSAGSVRRARERAAAGLPRPAPPSIEDPILEDGPPGDLRAPPRRFMGPTMSSNPPRGQRQRAATASNLPISRPTQVPQWPLAGPPLTAINHSDSERYRPPPDRPQTAPQRPPRPSQVPSLLDQSRLQEPTPVFLATDSDAPDQTSPNPRSTNSTMGSIPDFPLPSRDSEVDMNHRSHNLGPPPSSRRGASSFYSHVSYVSPIPEESIASRSHRSYASSAAMPDGWPTASREGTPSYYEETDTEKGVDSADDEFSDESKLVRSASIGKRGKPSLVHTKSSASANGADASQRPAPSPLQPFQSGTTYVEVSSSSSDVLPKTTPAAVKAPQEELSPDAILGAYAAAGATGLGDSRPKPPASTAPDEMSAIRRPPKLDIDAVKSMEERGSITSLPDLIRRATRLATMIDRGRRPASRFDDLNDFFDEKGNARGGTKENSGLSDMLAAFPPPAHDRQSRGSWFRHTSWPLEPQNRASPPSRSGLRQMRSTDEKGAKPQRRRCCGLPVWAFVLLLILAIGLVAAAVLVPLEFFVFKNIVGKDQVKSELDQCRASLTCKNGGTNVMSKGVCSCICTNGFTGSDCGTSGSDGCSTTDLVTNQETIRNVTLGKALPRLIIDANKNFSIPLSGPSLMAKINSGGLSCIAQNSLVSFDGKAFRLGEATAKVKVEDNAGDKMSMAARAVNERDAVATASESMPTTLMMDTGNPKAAPTGGSEASPTDSGSANPTAGSGADPTGTFTVTEEVLDFARVAVLYVLQEKDSDNAEAAQSKVQRFLSEASTTSGVKLNSAKTVDIGNQNTLDLVDYKIQIGSASVGKKATTKRDLHIQKNRLPRSVRHGGSIVHRG